MRVEQWARRIVLLLCAGCGIVALGIGAGRWTVAGGEPFYLDPHERAARLRRGADDGPRAADFWAEQGVIAARRPVYDPAARRPAPAPTFDAAQH